MAMYYPQVFYFTFYIMKNIIIFKIKGYNNRIGTNRNFAHFTISLSSGHKKAPHSMHSLLLLSISPIFSLPKIYVPSLSPLLSSPLPPHYLHYYKGCHNSVACKRFSYGMQERNCGIITTF